jgi:Zn-dependent protease with chaperone function
MAALLYVLSLLLEIGSIASRWLVSVALLTFFMPLEQAALVALIIALMPIALSLLTLTGIPSGFLFSRLELGGRQPSQRELDAIKASLDLLARPGVQMPSHIFVTDDPQENAFVRGTSLYVTHLLIESDYLTAVLAHELGHLNTADGRILVALDRFLIPLGPNIAEFLNKLLVIVLKVFYWFVATVCGSFFSLLFSRNSMEAIFGRAMRRLVLELLPSWIINFSVGGISMSFMAKPWQWYFRQREYKADDFTAQLGQGASFIEFLELHQGVSLPDIMLPHAENPTHPPTELRVDRLITKVAELAGFGQNNPAQPYIAMPTINLSPTPAPAAPKVEIPLLNQSAPPPLSVQAATPFSTPKALKEASVPYSPPITTPRPITVEEVMKIINGWRDRAPGASVAERRVIAHEMGVPPGMIEQQLQIWKSRILRAAINDKNRVAAEVYAEIPQSK